MAETHRQAGQPSSRRPARRNRQRGSPRGLVLSAMILVLVQVAIGMVVNLFATIPRHHPGSQPANYLTGSYRSVAWALAHSASSLAAHAGLGLVLIIVVIAVAVACLRAARLSAGLLAVLAALLVIGAGFNGASFLDFHGNLSSLIMALLALGALACYGLLLYLLPAAGPGTATGSGVRAGSGARVSGRARTRSRRGDHASDRPA